MAPLQPHFASARKWVGDFRGGFRQGRLRVVSRPAAPACLSAPHPLDTRSLHRRRPTALRAQQGIRPPPTRTPTHPRHPHTASTKRLLTAPGSGRTSITPSKTLLNASRMVVSSSKRHRIRLGTDSRGQYFRDLRTLDGTRNLAGASGVAETAVIWPPGVML